MLTVKDFFGRQSGNKIAATIAFLKTAYETNNKIR